MKYSPDELRDLYEKDPEEFAKVTRAMIDDVINSTREENQDNLRRKQWQLEQQLNKIKNPIARMNKMISIFWAGVYEFIEVSKQAGFTKQPQEDKSDNVVDFKPKK